MESDSKQAGFVPFCGNRPFGSGRRHRSDRDFRAWTAKNGPSVFYSLDPQGNVCQRFGNQGALLSSDEYNAWGTLLATTQTGAHDVFGAGAQWGYYTDNETGLQLLTNRYYDPGTGRFLTQDPIGYGGGINLHGYAGNSPAAYSDPGGDNPLLIASIVFIGVLLFISAEQPADVPNPQNPIENLGVQCPNAIYDFGPGQDNPDESRADSGRLPPAATVL